MSTLTNNSTNALQKPSENVQKEQIKNDKLQANNVSNAFYYYVQPTNKQSTVLKKSISKDSHSESPRSKSPQKQHKDFKHKHIHKNSHQKKGNYISKKPYRQSSQMQKQDVYFKTKICPQFQRGQCKKGSACGYAHGEKELRHLPNLKKTKLCIAFKQGKCGKPSGQCKYAHGQAQLRKALNKDKQDRISKSPLKTKQNPQKLNMAYMMPQQYYPPPTGYGNYNGFYGYYPPSTSSQALNGYPQMTYPNPSSYSSIPPPPNFYGSGSTPSNYYYSAPNQPIYPPYPPNYGNGYPQIPPKDKQFY